MRVRRSVLAFYPNEVSLLVLTIIFLFSSLILCIEHRTLQSPASHIFHFVLYSSSSSSLSSSFLSYSVCRSLRVHFCVKSFSVLFLNIFYFCSANIQMATTTELDPVLRQALQLLHSPSTDAAENIRKVLDEIIKQRHGSNKMLVNTLSKKHLAEESLATGSGVVVKPTSASMRRHSQKSSDSSSNNSNSSPVQIGAMGLASGTATTATVLTTDSSGQQQEIPVIISMPDSGGNTITTIDDNASDDNIGHHLNDFADLACFVCGRIDLSAKNRLIECTKCTLLYHQECHTPQIADTELSNDQESSWCCTACKSKSIKTQLLASPAKSYSSHSSNSSSSSSSSVSIVPTTLVTTATTSVTQAPATAPTSSSTSSSSSSRKSKEYSRTSSSRHHHHHSSSGSRSGSGSGSSKSSITPNINIISADKRLQNMKKKAAKTHESKRKK